MTFVGVHSPMQLMHPNQGHVTKFIQVCTCILVPAFLAVSMYKYLILEVHKDVHALIYLDLSKTTYGALSTALVYLQQINTQLRAPYKAHRALLGACNFDIRRAAILGCY